MSLLFSLFLCTGLYRQQQKPISVARLIKMPTRCKFYSFQIKKKKKILLFFIINIRIQKCYLCLVFYFFSIEWSIDI
jgi:hypothetical protein